jgi:prepilin-type N-terminal cleavage/methylation domain-containing protein
MKQKAFTLIELLVVVAIIGTLSAVGVVAYNGYTKSAKAKTAELNYTNINKALMFEFMKCELDSSSTVFNNHKCGNPNSPSINTISGFITNNLKMSNPYGSNLINKSPCAQGSVSISSPSKGNYSVSFYSAPQKKVGSNTKYTNVNTGCNTTWTSVNTGANTTYKSVNTGSNTKYSSP